MNRRAHGFTLIELLIVVAIVAMLMMMGGANYITSQQRARDARRVSDLEQVKAALEMYRVDKGYYPYCDVPPDPADGTCSSVELNNPAAGVTNFEIMIEKLSDPLNQYTNVDFKDPSGGSYSYVYVTTAPKGYSYVLCAYLERGTTDTCPVDFPSPYNTGYGFYSP